MGHLCLFEPFKRIINLKIFTFAISLCLALGGIQAAFTADDQVGADSAAVAATSNDDKPRQVRIDEIIDVTSTTTNETCLECHGVDGFSVPKGEVGESPKKGLYIKPREFEQSVHQEQTCVDCHVDIKKMPHEKSVLRTVDCFGCHKEQAASEKGANNDKLLHNANNYLASVHAKPNKDNADNPNAQCWDCHGKHNVFAVKDKDAQTYRLSTPETCGL